MPAIAGSAAQERDPSRTRSAGEPSSASAPCTRHSSAAPSGSAGMAPWRLTASLTPGTRASLVEEAIPGCGLGALGSGCTLGIDWPEATPYDSESVGSGTMQAPAGGSASEPKAGSERGGPVVGEHEGVSSGCGGAGEEEGDEAMADSDINKLPAYRLGALETKVDRMQEDVKALDGRVTALSERVNGLSERVNGLSERVKGLAKRLTALYGRVTAFEKRTDKRFDRIERQLEKQDERQRSDFRILFRSILAIGGLILAAETGLIEKLTSAVSPLFP